MRKKYIWVSMFIITLLVGGYLAFKLVEKNGMITTENRAPSNSAQNSDPIKTMVENYKIPDPIENFAAEYDVIVIGGEPEGVAAAVSAARNGANVLLVEKREELGGLFTYGMLNFLDIPRGMDGTSVSRGIFEEWHQLVGGQNAFGITEAKAAFHKLVAEEPNITLSVQTDVTESVLDGNRVSAVKLKNPFGEFKVSGKTFIDATQDADFAVLSQVPYFTGGEDIGIADKKMAVTLMIHLKNIDWKKVKEVVKSEKFGEAGIDQNVAWGFTDLHSKYQPVEENTRLRGLNLVKVGDEYFINALQIFGVDGLDQESRKEAIEKGKRETVHIVEYLREEFPGFEEAEIISFPTELYVRETRHIWAEYQLPMSDVWTNKDHWDSIGLGAYPVDVQAQTPHDYGYVLANPKQYAIPFRSLVPKEIDGLLVVGRSTGYSSLAAGSARVVPTGMVTGEAAGAAAALAVQETVSFREMSQSESLIETLRETLDAQGAEVDHFEAEYPYEGHLADESIQTLIDYGLVVGGYENELPLKKTATKHGYVNLIKSGIERANPLKAAELKGKLEEIYNTAIYQENGPLTQSEALSILGKLFFSESEEPLSWSRLVEKGMLDQELADQLSSAEHELTMAEVYIICSSVIDYVKNH